MLRWLQRGREWAKVAWTIVTTSEKELISRAEAKSAQLKAETEMMNVEAQTMVLELQTKRDMMKEMLQNVEERHAAARALAASGSSASGEGGGDRSDVSTGFSPGTQDVTGMEEKRLAQAAATMRMNLEKVDRAIAYSKGEIGIDELRRPDTADGGPKPP